MEAGGNFRVRQMTSLPASMTTVRATRFCSIQERASAIPDMPTKDSESRISGRPSAIRAKTTSQLKDFPQEDLTDKIATRLGSDWGLACFLTAFSQASSLSLWFSFCELHGHCGFTVLYTSVSAQAVSNDQLSQSFPILRRL